MKLAEFSVNRKITVLMLTILVLIVGGISLTKLGLEMFPDMDYPVVSIITTYDGASSIDVEEMVTKNLEMAVSTVKNIKNVQSISSENTSLIMLEFDWGTNLDFAAQDLRDVIDQFVDYLPDGVSRPMVMKFNLSQMPILMFGVTGLENTYELRKILEDDIATKLKQANGVASVNVVGGDVLEKQIIIDKQKLEQFNIGIDEVVQIIRMQNFNMPAGHIQNKKDEFLLRTVAQYSSLQQIANTPIKITKMGNTIYLNDIATVQDGFKEHRNTIRTNGKDTSMMMISKESGANTLTVVKNVFKKLDEIKTQYEGKIEFHNVMDMGRPISKTTNAASMNLIIGGLLSIIVMFYFLRNWRPTLVISLAIPISVVATFVPIYLANFTLNIMTLGGLALGVGMLVDNSIVVIENIYRQMELGLAKKEAAKIGATEVAMAITASTLTTIAVFFPMLFSEGMTGTLVRGLALTVAFALSASLFVALTIVPALASTIFKNNNKERKETRFEKLRKRYLVVLDWSLRNRKKTLLMVVSLFVASFGLLTVIGTEFMPSQDVPMMMLTLKMPKGTTLEETDAVVKQVEQIFMKTEGVRNVMGFTGPMSEAGSQADPTNPQDVNEAGVYVRLFEKSDRDIGYLEIEDIVRKQLPKIDGATFKFLSREEMMGGGASKPIEIKIYGRDLVKLKEVAGRIEERLLHTEKVKDVINSVKEGKPEVHIVVDKDKAFKYGLTSAQIASSIKTATIGTVAGVFRKSGEEIDIRVQLDAESRNSFDDIEHLSITSPMGFTVPLNQLAHIEHRIGETNISREQQMRKATISAGIDGKNLGKMVKIVKANIQDIEDELPTGYFVEFGGAYGDMLDAFKTLLGALILAMILVYIVMASQFESLKQPFIVMFTMPLAFIGVLLILFLTGTTLSVYSFVGIIILSGIVVNNGIVLVDHINQLRIKGFEKHKALMQAGADRMRPVIITALTTITGMLPMALDNSEGSEMKIPMALTVIGGLLSATFFTLVVIPVIYSVMDKKTK